MARRIKGKNFDILSNVKSTYIYLYPEDKDAEYIKLKYNILGLRFITQPGCKLGIQSPKEICGSFKKIRREKFTWNITRDDVE